LAFLQPLIPDAPRGRFIEKTFLRSPAAFIVLSSAAMGGGYFTNDTTRAERVRDLFDAIAPRYDLINDLQSLWLHRSWKKRFVALANPRSGQRALDLCCGTGDIAFALARNGADVTGLDFSKPMLDQANRRNCDLTVTFREGDVLETGLPDDHFDCVTIAFGLRNLVSFENGLREMHRLTKPGGKMLVLDFGKPTFAPWRWIYFCYLKWIVPWFGRLICRDAPAYAYIHESLENYPAQAGVEKVMHELGCKEITIHRILGSAMTINVGVK
jgi:demethylmenaquinone methyltransferase / 2-methoxy-6-polyprenyl-1,4-benzoquinol methylase